MKIMDFFHFYGHFSFGWLPEGSNLEILRIKLRLGSCRSTIKSLIEAENSKYFESLADWAEKY